MKRNIFFISVICAFTAFVADAAVVPRPTNTETRAPVSRARRTSAVTLSQPTTTTASTNETVAISETTTTAASEPEPEIISVSNKSSQFDATLDNALEGNVDSTATDLAERIRAQRAALDAADNVNVSKSGRIRGSNTCDNALRQCMTDKCGTNFLNCASDTDTQFGTKLDSCRNNTNCTAHEFQLLAAQIKADRSTAVKLKQFDEIIDCGKTYDSCIIAQCGTTYSRCLGKNAGDEAVSKCQKIARACASMDSGLAARTMAVFGTLRQNAERQISKDEAKLYELRSEMKSLCTRLGAMFDERSLDCVYTVNFYAGGDSTLFASKKSYAGGSFDCTPNWFGVDVTTYRENAYRRTREQSSASSAILGSGVGMAVGAITSGAINRAINSKNSCDGVKQAACDDKGGTWNSFWGTCKDEDGNKIKVNCDGTVESGSGGSGSGSGGSGSGSGASGSGGSGVEMTSEDQCTLAKYIACFYELDGDWDCSTKQCIGDDGLALDIPCNENDPRFKQFMLEYDITEADIATAKSEKPAGQINTCCMPLSGTVNGVTYDYTPGAKGANSVRGYDDAVECARYMGIWTNGVCTCGENRTWYDDGTIVFCSGPNPEEESMIQREWCFDNYYDSQINSTSSDSQLIDASAIDDAGSNTTQQNSQAALNKSARNNTLNSLNSNKVVKGFADSDSTRITNTTSQQQ